MWHDRRSLALVYDEAEAPTGQPGIFCSDRDLNSRLTSFGDEKIPQEPRDDNHNWDIKKNTICISDKGTTTEQRSGRPRLIICSDFV